MKVLVTGGSGFIGERYLVAAIYIGNLKDCLGLILPSGRCSWCKL